MPLRIAVSHHPGRPASAAGTPPADLLIGWHGEQANISAHLGSLRARGEPELPTAALDLLDIAVALFAADIAVKRGERERWPRSFELSIPVRDASLWRALTPDLHRLVHELARDSVRLSFLEEDEAPPVHEPTAEPLPEGVRPDCVSTLSGGLDSLAGAVTLQQVGRAPLYVLHRSGNPAVRRAQQEALGALESRWPAAWAARACDVEPRAPVKDALPYPAPEDREPSRRCRSLLFMALALAAAEAMQVTTVYLCENGVLTAALPFSAARAGSMSTHSTHPLVVKLMNGIAEACGLGARIMNPFMYETKSELIRDVLAPTLTARQIGSTVSCWAVGRTNRQCGGCVPCILRQIGMAWAELPEEAYMTDVLERPGDYVGTDAYGNLVDVLRQAEQILRQSDEEVLLSQPGLLSLQMAGVNVGAIVSMLRRHASQTLTVVRKRYPHAAGLIQ